VTVINLLALSIPYVGKLLLEMVKISLGPQLLRSFPNFKLRKRGPESWPGTYVEIVKAKKVPKNILRIGDDNINRHQQTKPKIEHLHSEKKITSLTPASFLFFRNRWDSIRLKSTFPCCRCCFRTRKVDMISLSSSLGSSLFL